MSENSEMNMVQQIGQNVSTRTEDERSEGRMVRSSIENSGVQCQSVKEQGAMRYTL